MKVALQEALLRRKELQQKVDQLRPLDANMIYEVKVQRRQASENIDDITMAIPKITFAEFTAEYDYYAKALRRIDAVIQRANWETNVEVDETMMENRNVSSPAG